MYFLHAAIAASIFVLSVPCGTWICIPPPPGLGSGNHVMPCSRMHCENFSWASLSFWAAGAELAVAVGLPAAVATPVPSVLAAHPASISNRINAPILRMSPPRSVADQ
jgi:hypothetical protein